MDDLPVAEKNINVRFPYHIWKRLEEQAKRDGRSKNAFVVQCVIDYLNSKGYFLDMVEDHSDSQKGRDNFQKGDQPEEAAN